ncbi:DUF2155 domain-containing protein [Novosphingobium sp.]|uniref:DUF2155 domain-containing protein n=1 Tax=Novosphingobium sp. TaxID=1874826 RepID=UPI0027353D6E|nr:DUF2155 domain-containing protein [Novosphingobium sp.]MDP3907917.1 DUF2155 domain-containing protein [Novosphingobium sp.]
MKRALAPVALLLLAACSGGSDDAQPAATDIPKAVADQVAAPVVESEYGTPVKDRVATLGLLNKRNNLTQDLVLKPGESRRVGNVVVRLASCERTLPWESPAETGAFVQVFIEERAGADQPLQWRKVFSGWLFRNSPSLNVVEHPVYDVWVKDCAMKFPGEEEDPAAAASSAAKPSGNAPAAPATPATPAPKPSASPSPAASPSAPAAAAPSVAL